MGWGHPCICGPPAPGGQLKLGERGGDPEGRCGAKGRAMLLQLSSSSPPLSTPVSIPSSPGEALLVPSPHHLAGSPPPLPAALSTTNGTGGVCPAGSDAFQGALLPHEGSDRGSGQASNSQGVAGAQIPLRVPGLPFWLGCG